MAFDLHTYLRTHRLPSGPVVTGRIENDDHVIPMPAVESSVRNEEGSLSIVAVAINLVFIGAIASWIVFF